MCGRFTQQLIGRSFTGSLALSASRAISRRDIIFRQRRRSRSFASPATDANLCRCAGAWFRTGGSNLSKEMPLTFNARAERVADGPMWRSASNRVDASFSGRGFYELTGPKSARIPHYFSAPDGLIDADV